MIKKIKIDFIHEEFEAILDRINCGEIELSEVMSQLNIYPISCSLKKILINNLLKECYEKYCKCEEVTHN